MSITRRTVSWTVPACAAAFAALEGDDQLTGHGPEVSKQRAESSR